MLQLALERAPKLARLRGMQRRTRAARLAAAPKIPDAQLLRYLQVMRVVQGEVQALIERELMPAVDQLDAPTTGLRLDAPLLGGDFEERFAKLNEQLGRTFGSPEFARVIRAQGEGAVQHATKETARTMSIDLRGTEGQLEPYVQKFIRDNVNLIRSVTMDQLGTMRDLVSAYHAGQVNQKGLRDQIMDTFGVSRSRANLIARDQILKANADITRLRQQQVGVTEYVWTTSNDERVRGRPDGEYADTESDHWRLDGKTFKWSEPPVTNERTGARNHPGQDYQCRCVAVPVVDHLLGR